MMFLFQPTNWLRYVILLFVIISFFIFHKIIFVTIKRLWQSINIKFLKQNVRRNPKIGYKIIFADTPEKCDDAVQCIRSNLSNNILGFDCEWVNNGPVSLIQLATLNGICGLFHISKIGYIPHTLYELLASDILKVGVATFEDGRKLMTDYDYCHVCGTVDLRTLAESLNLMYPRSLATMSLYYLGVEMIKSIEVRCSDWDADTLTEKQRLYAAFDAITSVYICDEILQCNVRKYSLWEIFILCIEKSYDTNSSIQFLIFPYDVVDKRYKVQQAKTRRMFPLNPESIKINKCDEIIKDLTNSNYTSRRSNIPTRNKPFYDNCYLEAPNGEILCTCDFKKANWYITKGLGDLIKRKPFTVRLRFEPSGRAVGDVGRYYTQEKVNQCVVCGTSDEIVKKNVVPREYRKYFPLLMKSHQSHDVLLLCPSCHEVSNCCDLQLRRKLADMCDAPLAGPLTHVRNEYIHNRRKLYSTVKALREIKTLPDARRHELENYILEYTNKKEITLVLLNALHEELKNSEVLASNSQFEYQPHGVKVVEYFQKREEGLENLERMWRKHFLLTMKPKYLPNLWSVCYNQGKG